VNYTQILDALREFTSRERIEFLPLAPEARPLSDYPPIQKYVPDLKNIVKPETAAEDLFTALCKDVLGFQPTRQVAAARDGWISCCPSQWENLSPWNSSPSSNATARGCRSCKAWI
jgi:hypothetical protein